MVMFIIHLSDPVSGELDDRVDVDGHCRGWRVRPPSENGSWAGAEPLFSSMPVEKLEPSITMQRSERHLRKSAERESSKQNVELGEQLRLWC
jgi:hypothetical protein